jgi:hypothetical protein
MSVIRKNPQTRITHYDYADLASEIIWGAFISRKLFLWRDAVTAVNTPINMRSYEGYESYEGYPLRLIVAGVNSFHSRDECQAPMPRREADIAWY